MFFFWKKNIYSKEAIELKITCGKLKLICVKMTLTFSGCYTLLLQVKKLELGCPQRHGTRFYQGPFIPDMDWDHIPHAQSHAGSTFTAKGGEEIHES